MSLYDTAVDQIKGAQQKAAVVCHLAEVTSLSDGKANVQFYGESSPSAKLYPYIEGYKPAVGDQVLMMAQGSTYVIIGKISKSAVTDNYYLKAADLDLSEYLKSADAATTYRGINAYFDRLGSGSNYVTISGNTATVNGTLDWGTNANIFRSVTATSLDAANIRTTSGTAILNLTTGLVTPASTDAVDLGSSTKIFKDLWATNIKGGKWYNGTTNASYSVAWSANDTISPGSTNAVNLGTSSKQFNNVYARQFYQNGTAISTSDKRKKKNIKDITQKYVEFFKKLKPRLFKFKDGESGRTHAGFIAQEVEEAAGEEGIDNQDLAFLCIDEDGNYGLRYEELIAIQTKIIQDLLIRVENLERSIK